MTRTEGVFVAARSSRGHLAHAVYVRRSTAAFRARLENGETPLALCRGAYLNVLISERFDTYADEQDTYRSCEGCASWIRSYRATRKFIDEAST